VLFALLFLCWLYAALFPCRFRRISCLCLRLRATTGYRPFTDDNFNTFVEMATTMNNKVREHCDSPEYAILFQVRYTGLFCLPVRGVSCYYRSCVLRLNRVWRLKLSSKTSVMLRTAVHASAIRYFSVTTLVPQGLLLNPSIPLYCYRAGNSVPAVHDAQGDVADQASAGRERQDQAGLGAQRREGHQGPPLL
jgi:hypothetical protein